MCGLKVKEAASVYFEINRRQHTDESGHTTVDSSQEATNIVLMSIYFLINDNNDLSNYAFPINGVKIFRGQRYDKDFTIHGGRHGSTLRYLQGIYNQNY